MAVNDDAIRKGAAATALLENPDFITVMDSVRLSAFQAWARTQPEEQAIREQNYYLLLAADKVKEHLIGLRENAKLELHNAARDNPET